MIRANCLWRKVDISVLWVYCYIPIILAIFLDIGKVLCDTRAKKIIIWANWGIRICMKMNVNFMICGIFHIMMK